MGQENANEQPPPPPPTAWQVLGERIRNTPGSGLAFAVVPLVLLGYIGWYYYGAKRLDVTFYSVKLENIEITPQPKWIHTDLKAEVFRANRLSQLSLLEPTATATIAHAFEADLRIKCTNHVRKLSSGKVQVDVTYRHPVAMVLQEAGSSPGSKATQEGFHAIDEDGVILPRAEFTSAQVHDFFVIRADGLQIEGKGALGYKDPRVAHALSLCKLLEGMRSELQLKFIDVYADGMDLQLGGFNSWILAITTKEQRVIIWGHAPGKETKDELVVDEKIASIKAWLAVPPSAGVAQELDLRQRRGLGQRFTSAPPLKSP